MKKLLLCLTLFAFSMIANTTKAQGVLTGVTVTHSDSITTFHYNIPAGYKCDCGANQAYPSGSNKLWVYFKDDLTNNLQIQVGCQLVSGGYCSAESPGSWMMPDKATWTNGTKLLVNGSWQAARSGWYKLVASDITNWIDYTSDWIQVTIPGSITTTSGTTTVPTRLKGKK